MPDHILFFYAAPSSWATSVWFRHSYPFRHLSFTSSYNCRTYIPYILFCIFSVGYPNPLPSFLLRYIIPSLSNLFTRSILFVGYSLFYILFGIFTILFDNISTVHSSLVPSPYHIVVAFSSPFFRTYPLHRCTRIFFIITANRPLAPLPFSQQKNFRSLFRLFESIMP